MPLERIQTTADTRQHVRRVPEINSVIGLQPTPVGQIISFPTGLRCSTDGEAKHRGISDDTITMEWVADTAANTANPS